MSQSAKKPGQRRSLGGFTSANKVNHDGGLVSDNGERTLRKTAVTLAAGGSVFSQKKFSTIATELAQVYCQNLTLSPGGNGVRALKNVVENSVRDILNTAQNLVKPEMRLTQEHLREAECDFLGKQP